MTSNRRASATLALFLAVTCFGRAAAAADEIKTWTEPENGTPAPTYVAEGVVDAPPAQVWALVSRCADYVENTPSN